MSDYQAKRDAAAEAYRLRQRTGKWGEDAAFKAGADWARAEGEEEKLKDRKITEVIADEKCRFFLERAEKAEAEIERLKAELEQWRATTASRTQELQEIASAMNAANNWREQALKLVAMQQADLPFINEAKQALREFNTFIKEQGE